VSEIESRLITWIIESPQLIQVKDRIQCQFLFRSEKNPASTSPVSFFLAFPLHGQRIVQCHKNSIAGFLEHEWRSCALSTDIRRWVLFNYFLILNYLKPNDVVKGSMSMNTLVVYKWYFYFRTLIILDWKLSLPSKIFKSTPSINSCPVSRVFLASRKLVVFPISLSETNTQGMSRRCIRTRHRYYTNSVIPGNAY